MSRGDRAARLVRLLWRAESHLDDWLRAARKRIKPVKTMRLQAYRGYGARGQAELTARVLEYRNVKPAAERRSYRDNIRATLKEIVTLEIPDVEVTARFCGQEARQVSDEEGYVHFSFSGVDVSADSSWHPVVLGAQLTPDGDTTGAESEILIPPSSARCVVVSDIDDTVVETGASSVFRKTKVTLLRNATSRVAFEGISAFYQALRDGPDGEARNPVFYLSSSPWNLYGLFAEFMEIHELPKGPLLLRDLGLERDRLFKSSHGGHKTARLEKLLRLYPDLPFILVGDSGQKDPEIYADVIARFPGRIRAAYLRDVTGERRREDVGRLAQRARETGSDLLLVDDTLAAARHAADRGWIRAAAVDAVRGQRARDQAE